MLPQAIYQRVFHLRNGNATGTCFAIEKAQCQYIVTARHVIEGLQSGDKIGIFHEGVWKDVRIEEIRHSAGQIDVSTFSIGVQVCPASDIDYTSDGIIISQELYFLGFPYSFSWPSASLNRDFPFPLIKGAILSGIAGDTASGRLLILDGHNNPGFSGGPVVFIHGGNLAYGRVEKYRYRISSIISAYRAAKLPVYDNGKDIKLYVNENTGIVLSYDISHALNLIGDDSFGMKIAETARQT